MRWLPWACRWSTGRPGPTPPGPTGASGRGSPACPASSAGRSWPAATPRAPAGTSRASATTWRSATSSSPWCWREYTRGTCCARPFTAKRKMLRSGAVRRADATGDRGEEHPADLARAGDLEGRAAGRPGDLLQRREVRGPAEHDDHDLDAPARVVQGAQPGDERARREVAGSVVGSRGEDHDRVLEPLLIGGEHVPVSREDGVIHRRRGIRDRLQHAGLLLDQLAPADQPDLRGQRPYRDHLLVGTAASEVAGVLPDPHLGVVGEQREAERRGPA